MKTRSDDIIIIEEKPLSEPSPKSIKKEDKKHSHVPNYKKIRDILLQLHKVEDVIQAVRTELHELEIWKSKLETTLCSYVNSNCDKTSSEIRREILCDIRNQRNGLADTLRNKTEDTKPKAKVLNMNGGQDIMDDSKEDHIMTIPRSGRPTERFPVMKANQKVVNQVQQEQSNVLTSDSLREANDHIKKVRVYTEKGFRNMFKCLICSTTLTIRQNAKFHVRRIHFGERMACPFCHQKFYEYNRLAEHRRNCQENSNKALTNGNKKDSNSISNRNGNWKLAGNFKKKVTTNKSISNSITNGTVRKNPRAQYQIPKSYKNIRVRNPFKNFSLSQALSARVVVEMMAIPDNFQNLMDETPQRTKKRLRLAAALEHFDMDSIPKRKKKVANVPSNPHKLNSAPSNHSHSTTLPRQPIKKKKEKRTTLPMSCLGSPPRQPWSTSSTTMNLNGEFNGGQAPHNFRMASNGREPDLVFNGTPIVKTESSMLDLPSIGLQDAGIVGSHECHHCNEFFPTFSDLRMHQLAYGHPENAYSSTNVISLGFADIMNMDDGYAPQPNALFDLNSSSNFSYPSNSNPPTNFATEFGPIETPHHDMQPVESFVNLSDTTTTTNINNNNITTAFHQPQTVQHHHSNSNSNSNDGGGGSGVVDNLDESSNGPSENMTHAEQLQFIRSKIRESVDEQGQPLFECIVCSKLFQRRANIRKHIQLTHFGRQFRHICTGCNRDFYDGRSLNTHQSKCNEFQLQVASK